MPTIDPADPKFKEKHIQIIGPTGAGQGRHLLLSSMIEADIKAKNPLCLIDLSGYVYESVETWCEHDLYLKDAGEPPVLRFDFSEYTYGLIKDLMPLINYRELMARNTAFLVNLSPARHLTDFDAYALGSQIIDYLYDNRTLKLADTKPFYLYVDGFDSIISEMFIPMLDEGRKHGFFLVLAHQSLTQLKQVDTCDEDTYQSLMTETKTKLVFNFDELPPEDQDILADCDIIKVDY